MHADKNISIKEICRVLKISQPALINEKNFKVATKENKALNLLFHSVNYPGMAKKEAKNVKLILWRNNNLKEYATWTFIETGECCIVRRVIWKQRTDYNLNEPEIFCADAIISKDMLSRINNSFERLNLDKIIIAESMKKIIIDGIECGIIFKNKNLKWDNPSQPTFYELSDLHKNTINTLEMMYR